MAKPRIFLSSTFYDLRQIRADLERFIKQMGYEPILHERGKVPYGAEKKLEHYCYKELEICDIVVAIVGGRFGSPSEQLPYSISQVELKTAVEKGRPLFIFVERRVMAEYRTYLKNKTVSIEYTFVDSKEVYRFIEEVEALSNNNPIFTFETAQDISDLLREQWAGLFQRFLQERHSADSLDLAAQLQGTAALLSDLVKHVLDEGITQGSAIQDTISHILVANHPAFARLRRLTFNQYRVFFTNRGEMVEWLKARGYNAVAEENWDDPEFEEYIRLMPEKHKRFLLKIKTTLFEGNGTLKVIQEHEWNENWITMETSDTSEISDDDIPF